MLKSHSSCTLSTFSWQVQCLVHFNCRFSWQVQYLRKLHSSWTFRFRGRAIFGAVLTVTFVADAIFGEIWNDSRSARCCVFQCKMLVESAKSNLGCRAGCGLLGLHGRIMVGSCSDHGMHARIMVKSWLQKISCVFLEFFVAGAVFGVGGWLLLLRAMQMTFMCCDYQT